MDAKTPSQYRRSLLPFYAIAILGACQQLMGADEASSTAGRVTPLSLPAGTVLLGLSEVSPGTFVSLPGAEAYLFTSQGKLTPFCQTPATLGPDSVWVLQAVNGLLYGTGEISQNGKPVGMNFSFGLNCEPQSYPNVTHPVFSIPTADGYLYGTQALDPAAGYAFVRMALDGTLSTVHAFSSQEGVPFHAPILGTDGNFYGQSTLSNGAQSVYRMTPQGDLTTLVASIPQGSPLTNPQRGATLIQAGNGKLYGITPAGGGQKAGTIFELQPDGSAYERRADNPDRGAGWQPVRGRPGRAAVMRVQHPIPHQLAREIRDPPASEPGHQPGLPMLDDPRKRRQILWDNR